MAKQYKRSPLSPTYQKAVPDSLPVTPPNGSNYGAGGTRTGHFYYPPNPDTLAWETLSTPELFENADGTDKVYYRRNIQYLGDSAELDSAIKLLSTNNRLLKLIECNFRVRDHVAWGHGGNMRVIVQNCNFWFIQPNAADQYRGRIFDRDQTTYLLFENNYSNGGGGVKVGNSTGHEYNVVANFFEDINGHRTAPFTNKAGQLQMFQTAEAVSAILRVKWNHVKNHPDRSRVEDNVNIFHSSFTVGEVFFNFIDGAFSNLGRQVFDYTPDGNNNEYAGGGLLSEESVGLKINFNYLRRMGGYGIGNAGGWSTASMPSEIKDNYIVTGGVLREGVHAGKLHMWVNVGLYSYPYGSSKPPGSPHVVVDRNRVAGANWRDLSLVGNTPKAENQWGIKRNDYYLDESVTTKGADNQKLFDNGAWGNLDAAGAASAMATEAQEEDVYTEWKGLRDNPTFGNGILVGPKQ